MCDTNRNAKQSEGPCGWLIVDKPGQATIQVPRILVIGENASLTCSVDDQGMSAYLLSILVVVMQCGSEQEVTFI